ncbi:hypothetical protein FACS1894200_11660 [Spirochaetia bacterium]|nr:hypothetical protein FACS1894200_11660 [Spirochaetia bacterium]
MPEAVRTAEMYLAAVQEYGYALVKVPESMRTAELCRAAVQQHGKALAFVPKKLRKQAKKAAGIA